MKLQNFLLIILGVAVIIIVLFKDDTSTVDSDSQRTIDSLRQEMVKKELERTKLDSAIKVLQDSLVVYDQQLEKNQQRLRKLRRDYEEAIDSLGHLSTGGVQDFFTKRYPQ